MGGGTSKFKENDWEAADGGLQGSTETIDGAPPTFQYDTFFLTKKAVNQREFDVTDHNMNLLYTTRAVPGTIACFDVMGREMGQHLLRVMVDIRRRHWIVYRVNEPSFTGQIPDQTATDKLLVELIEEKARTGRAAGSPPKLYKKCCITVSWSRYLIVAVHFGEPSLQMILSAPSVESVKEEDAEDDLFEEASKIAQRLRSQSSGDDVEGDTAEDAVSSETHAPADVISESASNVETMTESPMDAEARTVEESNADLPSLELEDEEEATDVPLAPAMDEREVPTAAPPRVVSAQSLLMNSLARSATPTVPSSAAIRKWMNQQSKSFQMTSERLKEKSKSYLTYKPQTTSPVSVNPLEGAVDLNGPLVLCQEIYNKLVGNHQTSMVSKEKVIELLRQDIEQHEAEKKDDDAEDPMDGEFSEILEQEASPGRGTSESKEEAVDDDEETKAKQPLVGYWAWENTMRTHKVKLHAAKGTDLALHVVLAIIANQVRYERNAIAMTI